jgi:copper chaperone
MSQIFHVQGMSCSHCEKAIERAIRKIDPLAQVSASHATQQVEVDHSSAPREALVAAIREQGYTVQDHG